MSKLFKTVEDYIKNVPKDEQGVFIDLREAIKEAAPEAEELISYQIPTYKFHGPLVHFKSGANYLSF
ncbi:hypothetical protein KC717_05565, partial [Candidatus Dojkabacteria bacterium]|nr:hypothetical protein [Candidatus Dojkabacteria bacterium]